MRKQKKPKKKELSVSKETKHTQKTAQTIKFQQNKRNRFVKSQQETNFQNLFKEPKKLYIKLKSRKSFKEIQELAFIVRAKTGDA